jgi:hypothetical protein
MVEYAVLVAKMGLGTLGTFVSSAEVWLAHVNWELVAWLVLGLILLRFVTWAFRFRGL